MAISLDVFIDDLLKVCFGLYRAGDGEQIVAVVAAACVEDGRATGARFRNVWRGW